MIPVVAAVALVFVESAGAQPTISAKLAAVDPGALVSREQIQNWLEQKDSFGPAYTAGPAWKNFMAFIHRDMKSMGITNITDIPFPYTRWYTTEYPDKSGWSLVSGGTPVEVASYGTQSGSTGPKGVTAPMVLYDLNLPVEQRPPLSALKGNIVVIKQQPYDTLGTARRVTLGVTAPSSDSYCGNPPLCKAPVAAEANPSPQWGDPGPSISYKDYEFRSDRETFATPLFEKVPVSAEASFRNRDQFGQIRAVITNVLMPSGAAAAITVMDLSPLAAAGTRIHPTPRQFNVPLLMLDRVAGEKVLAGAAARKTATLVLDAHEEENATAYETVAVLPGRNYGNAKDQSILLATHVDGPSIVEDDGALGILAVLHYYAKIPQSERPKSIVVYLESRHFVPGTEASYPFDVTRARPDIFKSVVGGLALEHFGGMQFVEGDNDYATTGKAATTYIWGWPNPFAIGEGTAAIKQQHVPRAINSVPAQPGVNGKPQQPWLGGGFSRYLVDLGGWPGWHISGDWPSAGFQAFYPAAKSRVSADVFLRQASAAVQLVNVLMTKDVIALAPIWGYVAATPPTEGFTDPAGPKAIAAAQRTVLTSVRDGQYELAKANLRSLAADADRYLVPVEAEKLKNNTREAITWADRALAWRAQGVLAAPYAATPPDL